MAIQRSGHLTFVTSAKVGNSNGHVHLESLGYLLYLL